MVYGLGINAYDAHLQQGQAKNMPETQILQTKSEGIRYNTIRCLFQSIWVS